MHLQNSKTFDLEEIFIDSDKVKQAITKEIPLVMTTYTLPRKVEQYIEQVIATFLDYAKQSRLKDILIYCIQELAVNAKKANTKRVYFIEQGLDLNDADDYKRGMSSFKDVTLNNIDYYLELQRRHGLYIRLILQLKDNSIAMEVRNNATFNEAEYERIRKQLLNANKYEDMEEAVMQMLDGSEEDMLQMVDDSEGAGLGLVMLVVMLKKLGLGINAFDILKDGEETIARITIPKDLKKAS
ncbi:MAG: hypothetical protein FWG29_03860 [Treponema sp.]|nr:hypothetical protein [Treponema sp.]